ncbi:ABC transporter substrate-binding protein [Chelativorans intermedius]|uniref:ABC transporter substrate-binding protein n=1 Tax=Chelativorans intermedius TaxID=515947 RepID=A0ABV6D9P7_9HYPH|nr:ABC transporter substrate-binding protein [Chelativorans intermedius]MCT8999129.1 ABC transporter substrate-binding protein [Chelativorans intermedius]
MTTRYFRLKGISGAGIPRVALAAGCLSVALAAPAMAFDCSEGAIRIGLARSITGGFAAFDTPGANGLQIAVDEINAAGGVEGCPIELISGDSQSNPALAGQVAEELIRQGAHIIVPASDMDMGMGAAIAAQAAGLLSISPESGSPDWVAAVGPNHFIGGVSAADLARSIARFINDQGWENVYVVTNESFNWFTAKDQPLAEALDGSVVGRDGTNNEMSDFAAIVSRIRDMQDEIDVIFLNDYFPRVGTFIRQLRAAGVTTPIVGESTFPSAALPEVVGADGLQDVYYVTSAFFEGAEGRDPALEPMITRYQEQFGTFPENLNAVLGYQIGHILGMALEQADSTDAGAVAAALRGMSNLRVAGTEYYGFASSYPEKSASVGGFDAEGRFVLVADIDTRDAE